MAENGAPPDEAVMIVMSRKSLRSGNRLVTKATSSRFSGDVRLQGQIGIFVPQCARRLELRRRARSGPARRDGVKQPPLSMPSLDQRLGLVVARLRGIAQSFGHVAVHHAFAGDEKQVTLESLLEQGVHRLRIDRAID